jgi:hypothetical protein
MISKEPSRLQMIFGGTALVAAVRVPPRGL